ncbi:protease-related family protein [Hibiscus syriacus]|uniref:Protease-related family protein n=1 Tax=Hibiscus syriacus TaxID=106335 RepID=A0A6A3BGK6_HIBSY|nr:protease-related family protein [Hibiscus syriacus]
MRHFHAALVDLIKELLKPTWREGHLGKDAHNIIVKKAVDKVLGSIQPHQFPITFESAKQYLSSSQPKIARLVEGYIDKYRKS